MEDVVDEVLDAPNSGDEVDTHIAGKLEAIDKGQLVTNDEIFDVVLSSVKDKPLLGGNKNPFAVKDSQHNSSKKSSYHKTKKRYSEVEEEEDVEEIGNILKFIKGDIDTHPSKLVKAGVVDSKEENVNVKEYTSKTTGLNKQLTNDKVNIAKDADTSKPVKTVIPEGEKLSRNDREHDLRPVPKTGTYANE